METIELKLLNPNDFKVLRVISFREKFTHAIGKICYFRPMTKDYQQGTSDEFDTILIEWLKAQNLVNVALVSCYDVCFEHEKENIQKIYLRKINTQLSLTCHGDYSTDELIGMGKINAKILKLNVYWDTLDGNSFYDMGNSVTFDKAKEEYYFGVIDSVESL